MRAPLLLAAAAVLGSFGSAPALAQAQMDSAPVLRCRSIPQPAARLACYDAIALPGMGSREGWGAPVATPGRTTPAPAAQGRVADPAAAFGLEHRSAQGAPDRLESRLTGPFEGWEPNDRFNLENGQIWQVVDGSRAYYGRVDRPAVSITRGMLGSFYMQIEGVAQTPRVRRVQ